VWASCGHSFPSGHLYLNDLSMARLVAEIEHVIKDWTMCSKCRCHSRFNIQHNCKSGTYDHQNINIILF
jgi:hypothetical protein